MPGGNKRGSSSVGTLRTPARLPRGPKAYREPKDKGYVGGAGLPPPGFLNGNNSGYEWQIYKAIADVTGYPENPRMPPFIGFPGIWAYQKAFDSGRHDPGGAVIDFYVYGGAGKNADSIAFRVQTEFFHIYTTAEKQWYDAVQFERLAQFMYVVDLFDQDFAADITNQAAVKLIRQALNGEVEPNPITNGTTQRVKKVVR